MAKQPKTEDTKQLDSPSAWWGVWLTARETWLVDHNTLVYYPAESIATAHAAQLTKDNVPAEAKGF